MSSLSKFCFLKTPKSCRLYRLIGIADMSDLNQMRLFLFKIRAGLDKEVDGYANVAVAPVEKELKEPSKYKVVAINDDYTPMDFVVFVLENFFGMTQEKATQVMLQIHTRGSAVCGIFTKDVAETKAELVNCYAREHQHPLLCKVEKAD